jgi:hypothetical protein
MFPHPSFSSLCRRAAALACAGLLAASCGGGSAKKAHKTETQTVVIPGTNVQLRLASTVVDTAGPAVTLDKATTNALMAQTRQYVNDAIIQPMLTGKPTAGYAALFSPTVSAAATKSNDRLALTDESVGKVSGNVKGLLSHVALTALADTNGAILYVASNFDLDLSVKVQSTPVAIKRHTELTFDKSPNGKWYITAYRVITTRLPRGGTLTTAVSNNAGKP